MSRISIIGSGWVGTAIGNDEEIPILELAKGVKELIKSKSEMDFHPLPKDDPPRRMPDITKAKEILGWEPKVRLREGLERTIRYFGEMK